LKKREKTKKITVYYDKKFSFVKRVEAGKDEETGFWRERDFKKISRGWVEIS